MRPENGDSLCSHRNDGFKVENAYKNRGSSSIRECKPGGNHQYTVGDAC